MSEQFYAKGYFEVEEFDVHKQFYGRAFSCGRAVLSVSSFMQRSSLNYMSFSGGAVLWWSSFIWRSSFMEEQ